MNEQLELADLCRDPQCPYQRKVVELENEIKTLRNLSTNKPTKDTVLIEAALDVVKMASMHSIERRADVELMRHVAILKSVLYTRGVSVSGPVKRHGQESK